MKRRIADKAYAASRAIAFGAALGLSLLLAAPAGVCAAPDQKKKHRPRVAEDEVPSNKEPRKDLDKGGTHDPRPPRPKVVLYDVTFTANMPDVALFDKREKMVPLGKTGPDSKAKTQLTAGRHYIIASRQGHQMFSATIEVRARGENVFPVTVLPVVAVKKEEKPQEDDQPPAPPPQPPAPTPAEVAAENAARVQRIFERFLDPRELNLVPVADWEFVLAHTGEALKLDPTNTSLQARAHFTAGQLAYLKGDYVNALASFNKAVQIEPKMLPALYGIGNALLGNRQYAGAFQAYQQAAAVDEQFALAYKGMGNALARQNKHKEAQPFYDKFKDRGGLFTTDERMSAAAGLIKREEWGKALDELLEIVKTRDTAEVHLYIGDCYVGLKRRPSASESYMRAITLDPSSGLAYYKYGENMSKQNEHQKAYDALTKALELDKNSASFDHRKAQKLADEAAKKMKKKK